jgi:hypothetical protein
VESEIFRNEVLVIIEVFNDFSVSESHVSNSGSLGSGVTEVDPVPISEVITVFNSFVWIDVIVSISEFEVIGREGEVSFRVELDHKGSVSEDRSILLVRWFIDGKSEG